MAAMIAENSYLIPDHIRNNYSELNRYIVVVTDLDSELYKEKDITKEKLDKLKKTAIGNMELLMGVMQEMQVDF